MVEIILVLVTTIILPFNAPASLSRANPTVGATVSQDTSITVELTAGLELPAPGAPDEPVLLSAGDMMARHP